MKERTEVRIGDRLRFSVELIEQIQNEGGISDIVVLKKIEEEPNGALTLWLEREKAQR